MKANSTMRRRLITVTLLALLTIAGCFAQNPTPVKVSLRHIGRPQFPTGFWISNADPHFRHRVDRLFWLSPDKIATTFFKESCCRSGSNSWARYAAATFDLAGKTMGTHEWTSTADSSLYAGGIVGAFWVRYRDRVVVLSEDFAPVGQIPLPVQSKLIWSKSGHGVAVQAGTTILLYDMANLAAAASVAGPSDTRVVDVRGDAVLVNSVPKKPCLVRVVQATNDHSWNVNSVTYEASGRCASGFALLSEDAVLLIEPGQRVRKIAHRDAAIEAIPAQGELIGIADSGRMAFQLFYPNSLAQTLDMEFGGHKEISIYDPSTATTVFHTKIGGQSGAALSPDGRHLAVIDGNDLLIYTLPK